MAELKQPCRECPFRRQSAPGWLGPWSAEELVWAVTHDSSFPCHKTIPYDGCPEDDPRLMQCAGAAIFLSNQFKLSRDHEMMVAQQALRGCTADLKASVFQWPKEFTDHHTSLRRPSDG